MRKFMAIIMLLTSSIEYAMSEGRLHSESFGYIYGSWSHSDTIDTSRSLDSGNGYGKDALYDFTLCKPSIIVIDHAGAVLKDTRMTLTRMYEPGTIHDRWAVEMEGAESIADSKALLERMKEFYPMFGDVEKDILTIVGGQAFLCMEIPAGHYALRCEGNRTGNNGLLTTNFRFYALGASPEEAVDLGVLSPQEPKENLYYSKVEEYDDPDYMYFKFKCPSLMPVTVDGVCSRGTKGNLELLDKELKILDTDTPYPLINDFYPQIKNLFIPRGTYYVRVSRYGKGTGLTLIGMNVRVGRTENESTTALSASSEHNYIVTSTAGSPDGRYARTLIDYYDGLGRPRQSVLHAGCTDAHDIILTSTQYDKFGRIRSILSPTPSTKKDGSISAYQEALQTAITFHKDNCPMSRTEYTQDHISRTKTAFGPGQEWQSAGKAIRYGRTSGTLKGFKAAGNRKNPILEQATIEFNSPLILASEVTDEDGRSSIVYTDGEGKTLCVETADGRTYYAYDRYGNLSFVLPPQIEGGRMPSDEELDKYAFMYRYDEWNRCIGVKTPGAEWTEYILDFSGHRVMSRDDNLRKRGEWRVMIPDVFGRPAIDGIFHGDPDRTAIGALAVRAVPDLKSRSGYRINVPSLNSITISESIFYDNYSFLSLPEFQARALRYTEETGYGRMYGSTGENIAHKGLMTGRMLCKEGCEGYVCEAYYYDYRKRIVQTRKITHDGGVHTHLARYTYTGEVEEELTRVSPRSGSAADSIHTMRIFDRHGRLVKEAVEVNGSHPAVRKFTYDGIGRQEHVETGVFGNVASSEYGFNVRGWQTETNSKSVAGDTLFASELRYCSDLECPDSTPLYGGDISEWVFTDGTGTVRTYSLAYGKTGKLKDASLYSDGIPDNSFAETGMKYDKNGNMTAIVRSNASLPQNLSLTYDGNRLVRVSMPSEESGKYSYDSCGNMTHDGLHGFDISYNRLNLPETISENGSTIVKYDYLWDGTKIRTMTDTGKGMEYHGPMTYRVDGDNFRLDEARLPWVRFVRTTKTDGEDIEPVYIFRDHLGSVRAMVTADSALTEKDSYLPFGIRWNEDATSDENNRYRFNSKEEQAFAGLPYIDFGTRLYDPVTARWLTPDPLAEKYYSVSPYTFCNDDPINHIDPDGRKIYFVAGTSKEFEQYFYEVVEYMKSKGTAYDLEELEMSNEIYYIEEITSGGGHFDRENMKILWDPSKIIEFDTNIRISPMTILAHEASHARMYDEMNKANKLEVFKETLKYIADNPYQNIEEQRVITTTEQIAARKHGEIREDQQTRSKHKEKNIKLFLTGGAKPELISIAVFEHNNLL